MQVRMGGSGERKQENTHLPLRLNPVPLRQILKVRAAWLVLEIGQLNLRDAAGPCDGRQQ